MNTEPTPTASLDLATGPDSTATEGLNNGPTAVKQPAVTLDPTQMRTLKTAFRKWKRSRKRGAATLVTRYTRRGKPVY